MAPRVVALTAALLLAVGICLVLQPSHARADEPPSLEDGSFFEACWHGAAVLLPEAVPGIVHDCAILLRLKEGLTGRLRPNWSPDRDIRSWMGVRITVSYRVTTLDLRGLDLRGEIPAELARLSGLRHLLLASEGLEGELPPWIGTLTNLRSLWIEGTNISGPIPAWLGRLSNLERLAFYRNQLSGPIPPELGQLTRLDILILSENNLEGEIPPEVRNLANLKVLGLNSNPLTGEIPPELAHLTHLETLFIGNTYLTCAPPGLDHIQDGDFQELRESQLPDCPDAPAPADTGTGLAPTPHGALPAAVNVFAIVATVVATLGIVAGVRTRHRP